MGDGLGFIFKRLYFTLVSGCIINIYVFCVLFVKGKVEFLYDRVRLFGCVEFSPNISIFIFIFFTLVIVVFFEGFIHFCRQYCAEHPKQDGKINLIRGLLIFLIAPGAKEACIYYWEDDKKKGRTFENSRFKFMYDPVTGQRHDKDDVYRVMQEKILIIARELKNEDFYRFKEFSHMARGMKLSFILIAFVSFLGTIIRCSGCRENIGLFYVVSFFVSSGFVVITWMLSGAFSKKHVCKVGECYSALGLDKEAVEAAKADSHDTKGNTGSETSGA